MQIHVVQPKESLWNLSQQYGVSVQEISTVNEISDTSRLVIGQALVIPTPPGTYVVQPGDSLWTIAESYGTTVSTLAAQNQISNASQLSIGQRLRIPARNRRVLEANAYFTDFGTHGQQVAQQLAPHLTYLSPFSHHVGSDGSIAALDDTALLNIAKSQGAAPLLVLSNWSGNMFSSDVAHTVLGDTSIQQKVVDNALSMMRSQGYRGINIDFEYIYPGDRDGYNQFLRNISTQFHNQGYLVSTALAPKYSANQKGLLYEAHDYPVHGQLCDFVVLMTYEWGWIGGPPMAVSPASQIEAVLNYAVTAIPREKILMGVSVYGYDWKLPYVSGSLAGTLTPKSAVQRAASYGADIRYDTDSQAPYYDYVDAAKQQHVVWFEDARSFQAKLDIARTYRLRGISFWSYPTDFPQVPPVLADNFQIRKLS